MEIEIGSITALVVFVACVLGQAVRTLLPYFKKIETGEITHFNLKFFYTVVMAFAAALTPSIIFFPLVLEQIPDYIATMGLPFIFLFVAVMSYGANDIVNKGLKGVGFTDDYDDDKKGEDPSPPPNPNP